MKIETYHDPEYGTIAVARDDAGDIIATGADVARNGVRVIVDESAIYEATGELIAPSAWDIAEGATDEENQP